MTKEFYIEETERLKEALAQLRNDYLEANKPFPIGTNIKMMFTSGRIVDGIILTLGISVDKQVYVTSYKCNKDKKTKYCTIPQQKYKLMDG